jgi:hypothetical protein
MLIIDLRPLHYILNIYAIRHPQFYILEEGDLLFMVHSIIMNSSIQPPLDVSYLLVQSEMTNRHPELLEVYSMLEDLIQDLENTLLGSIPYGGLYVEHRISIQQHGPIASVRAIAPVQPKDTSTGIINVPRVSYLLHSSAARPASPTSFDF